MRRSNSPSVFFPPEYDSGWEKGHGRLQRWRLQRVGVNPESAGLCGCWQFIAVWRERQELRQGKVVDRSEEYSFYASSLSLEQHPAPQVAQFIRDHWAACEIGSHYRRDVSLNEDASRVGKPNAARAMTTLRNLVIGLFELQTQHGKADAAHLPGWQRKMRPSSAIQLITKGG